MAERPDQTDLTDADRARLQRMVEAFQQSWGGAGLQQLAPRLAQHLPPEDDRLYEPALEAFALHDFRQRWENGQALKVEQYEKALAQLRSGRDLLPRLLCEEYRRRLQAGEVLELNDYRQRYPAQFGRVMELLDQAFAPAASPAAPPRQPRSAPDVPQVGHNYKLIERVGSGSYGEVWKAEAPGGIAVAVKMISAPIGHRLSQTELQALEISKQLRHPFLLQIHSYWIQNERLAIAMELADGSLQDRHDECRRAGLVGIPLDELLRYTREAAEALDYLHGQQRVHRDIKPANILLVSGHAKLADLGLARLLEKGRLDVTASLGGTALYMAPEMWHSRAGPRSDQYSLAVTYAELRLGEPPFEGMSISDVMQKHLHDVPKLAALERRERDVIMKALSKKPQQRYESCSALVAALQQAVAPLPAETRAPRRWVLVALPMAVAALAAAAAAPWWWPAPAALQVPQRVALQAGDSAEVRLFLTGRTATGAKAQVAALDAPSFLTVQAPLWPDLRRDHPIRVAAALDAPAGVHTLVLQVATSSLRWQRKFDVQITPPQVCCPVDCRPTPQARMVRAADSQRVYWSEVHLVNRPDMRFVLVPATAGGTKTFYILDRKVTNRWFQAFAEEAGEAAGSAWRAGVEIEPVEGEPTTRRALPAAEYPDHPVFRVSAEEAYAFARWLHPHGHLPSTQQWDAAAGRYHQDGRSGPFLAEQFKTDSSAVAVGRAGVGPLPSGAAAADVSPLGVRDMAGNGMEWTSSLTRAGQRLPLNQSEAFVGVIHRGQSYRADHPLLYADIEDMSDLPDFRSDEISFRVVLEDTGPQSLTCRSDWPQVSESTTAAAVKN